MKLYTSSLWAAINSGIRERSDAAQKEWSAADAAYQHQWSRVRKYLPKGFISLYESYSFHDGAITQLALEYNKKAPLVKMRLCLEEKRVELRFQNVKSFGANLIDFSNCILNQLAWGYGEFEYLPSHQFKLSVLCDINNEIEIVFKKLEWEILE